MQIHEAVRNSGRSSSCPSRILPKRLTARKSAKSRKPAEETTNPQPKSLMTVSRTTLAVEDKLLGNIVPQATKPRMINMAGQKTAGSI
jgi:hypothetical protein